MLEDKFLVWKFNQRRPEALRRIYLKYKDDLLGLAVSLTPDWATAEDVLHDVFVTLAKRAGKLSLKSSLKSYLTTCVANRSRDIYRQRQKQPVMALHEASQEPVAEKSPIEALEQDERQDDLSTAMAQLPFDQREVVLLHLQADLRFREIAELHGESVNTIQSRYRYGLEKLRDLLNGKVEL